MFQAKVHLLDAPTSTELRRISKKDIRLKKGKKHPEILKQILSSFLYIYIYINSPRYITWGISECG